MRRPEKAGEEEDTNGWIFRLFHAFAQNYHICCLELATKHVPAYVK